MIGGVFCRQGMEGVHVNKDDVMVGGGGWCAS